jgi:hypothetical protein
MIRARVISGFAVVGLLAGGGGAYLTRPAQATAPSSDPGGTASAASSATSSAAPSPTSSANAAAESFNAWITGAGGRLLENSLAVLTDTRADAVSANYSGLESDGSSLVACGQAALADPPPSHTASWNAAFTAMVKAGLDVEARNLKAAAAESSIVQADILAFNAQIS